MVRIDGWEYQAPDGSRFRRVRVHPGRPLHLRSRVAVTTAQTPLRVRALRWLVAAALLGGWIGFLLHPWAFHLWWAPVRWPVEVAWVLGWIVSVLCFVSYCLVRLADALRG